MSVASTQVTRLRIWGYRNPETIFAIMRFVAGNEGGITFIYLYIAASYWLDPPYPMNQNPEQFARDTIDCMLHAAGWQVQAKQKINLAATTGVAVLEYQTDIGPADYVPIMDKGP